MARATKRRRSSRKGSRAKRARLSREPVFLTADRGQIASFSLPTPRPVNFSSLGVKEHPPALRRSFTVREPPHWTFEQFKKVAKRLLRASEGRSARGATWRIAWRKGVDGGLRYPPVKGLSWFTKSFDHAERVYLRDKGFKKEPPQGWRVMLRSYMREFYDSALQEVAKDEFSYSLSRGYWYSFDLVLLFNKRRYKNPSPRRAYLEWRRRVGLRKRGRKT